MKPRGSRPKRRSRGGKSPGARSRKPAARPDQERALILQDLHVHQEELRLQNEELRNTQLELEVARDRYSDLYDMAPVPCLTLNQAGFVSEANETSAAFLGIPRERLIRRNFAALLPPSWRGVFRHGLTTRPPRSRPMVLQVRMTAARGEVPVELHLRPTTNNFFHIAVVDLGERERTEAERRSLMVEAEVARAASAAKDQFLAALSHELRTPLTPIIAALSGLEPQVARGGLSMNELRDLFGMVRRNLDYEVRLIDDLLDASRMTLGKLTLDRQVVDLHAIISEVVSLLSTELRRKGLVLEVALTAQRHHVEGDPMRLRQVFWNLLRNAIKFTGAGGRVTMGTSNVGQVVRVDVQDSGVGISPADLPRIFDRFVQTAAGARAGGMGLGLTIVEGIVEAHGGRVQASSAGLNKGTRFIVELEAVRAARRPAATAQVSADTPTPGPAAAEAEAPAQARHILLVEDHEETAEILADLLRGQGYLVAVAHSVKEALAQANQQRIDLLITDIGLPDGSGLDLMNRLKPRLELPPIALSGYGRQVDVDRSRAAGFGYHLVKPVEFPALLRVIQRACARA
jgi:PAS domain S-box-containing protein